MKLNQVHLEKVTITERSLVEFFLPVRNFGIQRFYKKFLDRVISDKEEV